MHQTGKIRCTKRERKLLWDSHQLVFIKGEKRYPVFQCSLNGNAEHNHHERRRNQLQFFTLRSCPHDIASKRQSRDKQAGRRELLIKLAQVSKQMRVGKKINKLLRPEI